MLVTREQYITDLIDEYEDFLVVTRYHRTLVDRKDVIKDYVDKIINTKEKIAELKKEL